MILQEYKSVEDAIENALHWIRNTAQEYEVRGHYLKAQGLKEAIKCLEAHLSMVKE
ncbi:rubrerythrin [Elusimicrobium simillimum]|uniref:hypothetical protein n=1 Tax=Elusimicrobium simillimum TaxID=3143438 RepID=UPI003C7060F9